MKHTHDFFSTPQKQEDPENAILKKICTKLNINTLYDAYKTEGEQQDYYFNELQNIYNKLFNSIDNVMGALISIIRVKHYPITQETTIQESAEFLQLLLPGRYYEGQDTYSCHIEKVHNQPKELNAHNITFGELEEWATKHNQQGYCAQTRIDQVLYKFKHYYQHSLAKSTPDCQRQQLFSLLVAMWCDLKSLQKAGLIK